MTIRSSLSSRLSLYVLLATVGLFTVTFVLQMLASIYFMKEEVVESAKIGLDKVAGNVEGYLTSVQVAADNMIWAAMDNLDSPDSFSELTAKIVRHNPPVVGSSVAFESGYYPEKGHSFAPYSYRDEATGEIKSRPLQYEYFEYDWYKYPIENGCSYWSEPYFDEGGGEQMMTTFSEPLWDDEGHAFAVLTADMSLKGITSELSAVHQFPNSITFILSNNGLFISHPDTESLMSRNQEQYSSFGESSFARDLGKRMMTEDTGCVTFKSVFDTSKKVLIWRHLSNGWTIATACPYSDVFAPISKSNTRLTILFVLAILLMFLLVRKIVSNTTKPITEFTYTALNIGKGNFNATIPEVKTQDEMLRLRNSLSYMLQSINAYMTQLRSSVASNERFESELNIAKGIQVNMLCQDFINDSLCDVYASVTPAKEVGGDLYDFFSKDDCLNFCIGDVSGKGVPAALYMAITRAAFRFVSGLGLSMEKTVFNINNAFCEGNATSMFVTMFAGKINFRTMEMTYCNAGHNPIIVVSPSGQARYLNAKSNLAAGLMEDFPYEEEKITLEHGTRIILYTDGVTEAETVLKDQYGEERLLNFVSTLSPEASSRAVVDGIEADVRLFTGGNAQNDDITLFSVVIK